MMQRLVILALAVLTISFGAPLSDAEQDKLTYIKNYSYLAQVESKKYGIPASVILAQALHETGAGRSLLATRAKNHFGIKCKSEWEGATYFFIDDDKDASGQLTSSCFRLYDSVEESYRDHSLFLKYRDRYSPLFEIPVSDYAGWCRGLKECGYATDSKYSDKLIRNIERYNLHTLD